MSLGSHEANELRRGHREVSAAFLFRWHRGITGGTTVWTTVRVAFADRLRYKPEHLPNDGIDSAGKVDAMDAATAILSGTKLNPQQRQAASFGDDPLLIIAGAGTGKTNTLAHRV